MEYRNNKIKSAFLPLTRSIFLATAMAVSTVALPVHHAVAESGIIHMTASQHAKIIKVAKGKPKTIRTDTSFNEIVVGDPEIATVSPLTDRSFYVVGTAPGTTGVALYGENNELVGVLDIEVGPNTNQLNAALKSALPGSKVKASSANGKVVLKGKVKDAVEARKIQSIAENYDESPINAVKVESSQQVKLEVRFIEAQRNRDKELSIGFRGGRDDNAFGRVIPGTGDTGFNIPALVTGGIPFGEFVTRVIDAGTNVDLVVNALERKGVVRRLAEPNLVALSGDTASFLAGGEFPIPVGADDGEIEIEFKEFGVGLKFTPTVLDNGLINLKLAPEVSQIDDTNSIGGPGGIEIPALVVRRAETTLELKDGQSFVLAGLLQTNTSIGKSQLPWLGDIPIIGALFRSSAYQRDETDLVIIVTPRLVKPLKPGEEPATPLDETAPANDADLLANGQLEVSRAHLRKLADAREGVLKTGHIIELE